jgi:hypothetical protein
MQERRIFPTQVVGPAGVNEPAEWAGACANILIRAVLSQPVRELPETYKGAASYYSPDVCFADVHHYLRNLLEKRGRYPATRLVARDQLNGCFLNQVGGLLVAQVGEAD